MTQSFGGHWTLIKLDMLEKYLSFYTTALKNQHFKLCYIDAFAGSGNVDLRTRESVIGSAIRALEYPFDRYVFIEQDKSYLAALGDRAHQEAPEKNVELKLGDCNDILKDVLRYNWKQNRWRGVIFLDPYAMNLRWESLISIANTQAFDVWYLFPLSALIRCLKKDGNVPDSWRPTINTLLGTDEWEQILYHEPNQLSFIDDDRLERVSQQQVIDYIVERLRSVFPGVATPTLLRQRNNSPLFLLCFAVSNNRENALQLALNGANHILRQGGFS